MFIVHSGNLFPAPSPKKSFWGGGDRFKSMQLSSRIFAEHISDPQKNNLQITEDNIVHFTKFHVFVRFLGIPR